jgi:hypothetical protein
MLSFCSSSFSDRWCGGESLEGVLNLDLHHQLRAAAQIEPQVDVLFPVGDQLVLGLGNADDAVEADQDHRDDDAGFEF